MNSDNPQANGLFRQVVVSGTQHDLRQPGSLAIGAWCYDGMRLRDIDVFDHRQSRQPAIWITGFGASRDLHLQNVTIRGEGDRQRLLLIRDQAAPTVQQTDVNVILNAPASIVR